MEMTVDHGDDDGMSIIQIENIRTRVHKLADTSQRHEIALVEQNTEIRNIKDHIVLLATKESLTSSVNLTNVKLSNMQASITTIQRGVQWVIALVVGGVIMAVLALITGKP
jgi:hypothetical protein